MTEAIADVLRARRIEIIDQEGVVRGVFGARDVVGDGEFHQAYLELASPDGEPQVTLYCERDTAALDYWEGGNTVAYFGSNRQGRATFILATSDFGMPHIELDNASPIRVSLGFDSPTLRRIRRALRLPRLGRE